MYHQILTYGNWKTSFKEVILAKESLEQQPIMKLWLKDPDLDSIWLGLQGSTGKLVK